MPGRIVLVCKLKGGAGATTTCRELAAASVAGGLRVALIDLDAQGGLTRWWSRRTRQAGQEEAPNPALLEVPAEKIAAAASQLRERFDLTVIDSPPTVHDAIRMVAGSADLALIPSRPTVDDLDAVGPIARGCCAASPTWGSCLRRYRAVAGAGMAPRPWSALPPSPLCSVARASVWITPGRLAPAVRGSRRAVRHGRRSRSCSRPWPSGST